MKKHVDANHELIAKTIEEEEDNNMKSPMEYNLQKNGPLVVFLSKKSLYDKYYQTWFKRQNKHMSY